MLSSALRQTGQLRGRPATRIPTVCVVDRRAADYQGWESLARAKGAKLQIVASAEEALRLARTTTVDLWVINAELPGLSGIELCSMLKARSPAVPVYLVADKYSPASEQAAWAARPTMFGCRSQQAVWIEQWLEHCRSPHRYDSAKGHDVTAPLEKSAHVSPPSDGPPRRRVVHS